MGKLSTRMIRLKVNLMNTEQKEMQIETLAKKIARMSGNSYDDVLEAIKQIYKDEETKKPWPKKYFSGMIEPKEMVESIQIKENSFIENKMNRYKQRWQR